MVPGEEEQNALNEKAHQMMAARQLKEDVLCLKARWRRYNFPVQELLLLLLRQHGLDAATLATDALERLFRSAERE